MSSSICLVWAWKTRLCESKTTLRLSQRRVGVEIITFSSARIYSNQRSLEMECASAQYSASVFEQTTRDDYLELNEIKLGPNNMHEPYVYLLSS